jgi:hypothetical protein
MAKRRPREHAAVLRMTLSLVDSCTAQIDELTAKIEVLAEPWLHQIEQLDAVRGTGSISEGQFSEIVDLRTVRARRAGRML